MDRLQKLASSLLLLLPISGACQVATVTNVAAAAGHSLFLKSDGSAWGMGWATNRPRQLLPDHVVEVSGGSIHAAFLKSDGSLWGMWFTWGEWDYLSGIFQVVSNGVAAITRGGDNGHLLFIKTDGSLWAMGYNYCGQLGDGTFVDATNPVQVVASNVVASAAGALHSLFIKSDGSLWGMGRDDYGQLGDGTTNSVNTPVQVVAGGVTAVAAGGRHSLFIKADGSLWGVGNNAAGQLGDGTTNMATVPKQIIPGDVVGVAAGGSHSMFIKADGSLWAMGDDGFGQLGDGGVANKPPLFSTNRPVRIVASGVVAVAAGAYHTLFAKTDGSLWTMGLNNSGQLGDGFPILSAPGVYDRRSAPEQIVPSPQPRLATKQLNRTNLQFQATCDFGGLFALLSHTNIAQPPGQWTPIQTASVTNRGANNFSVTITNEITSSTAERFYILQSPPGTPGGGQQR